jgi:hypothetical protein
MKRFLKGTIAASLLLASSAFAGDTSATLQTTLTISGACSIPQTSINLSVNGMSGDKPVATTNLPYKCSTGLSPTLTSTRSQVSDGQGGYVEARVYSDSAHTKDLFNNPLPLLSDGQNNSVPLYLQMMEWNYLGPITVSGTFVFTNTLTISY